MGVRSRPKIPDDCAIKIEACLVHSKVLLYQEKVKAAVEKLSQFHSTIEEQCDTW